MNGSERLRQVAEQRFKGYDEELDDEAMLYRSLHLAADLGDALRELLECDDESLLHDFAMWKRARDVRVRLDAWGQE